MTDRDTITLPREVVFRAVKALTPMAYDTWPRERQEIVTALRTALAAEQPKPSDDVEALRRENEWLQFERDALLKTLRRKVHYAKWQEKHIHGVGEAVQNWVLEVNLPVPLLEPDKSPEAAFQRFVAATLRRERT